MTEERLNEIKEFRAKLDVLGSTWMNKALDDLLAEVKPEPPKRIYVPPRPWKEGAAATMDDGDVCTVVNELDRRIGVLRKAIDDTCAELPAWARVVVDAALEETEPEQ